MFHHKNIIKWINSSKKKENRNMARHNTVWHTWLLTHRRPFIKNKDDSKHPRKKFGNNREKSSVCQLFMILSSWNSMTNFGLFFGFVSHFPRLLVAYGLLICKDLSSLTAIWIALLAFFQPNDYYASFVASLSLVICKSQFHFKETILFRSRSVSFNHPHKLLS